MEAYHRFFEALTSHSVSRNKNFETFSRGFAKEAHQRYLSVVSLKKDAQRQQGMPGAACYIRREDGGLLFYLENPRMGYRRVAELYDFEWDWLRRQPEVRSLLNGPVLSGRQATL